MDLSKDSRHLALLNESEIVEASDPVRYVNKGWGQERWLVNIPSYCAKILEIRSGLRLSWHFHKVKEETFIVLSGQCHVVFGQNEDINKAERILLTPGSRFHVPPGLIHQLIAVTDCEILEVSTAHSDTDSYRVIKGD